MIAPWVLAAVYIVLTLVSLRRPSVWTSVPVALSVSMATWIAAVAWAKAAMDYWPAWAWSTTWVMWFCIGTGTIIWVMLAMTTSKDDNLPPPKERPKADNFVTPTVYGSKTRARYEWKGTRAKRR